ncbi:hypothetical protein FraQA3DRAFT_2231 [Frankia sp. QA3]|nr:hypothetical protein FraQA3DRAFT_2231 [Frankia sp. QA3]
MHRERLTRLACKPILAALTDAGLTTDDLDGFTIYSSSIDPFTVGSILGVPEVKNGTPRPHGVQQSSSRSRCVSALSVRPWPGRAPPASLRSAAGLDRLITVEVGVHDDPRYGVGHRGYGSP